MHRRNKDLHVHIVEQHNDVVPPIHRAIASRLLPFSGTAMIHLDSHPDLLLPPHMTAETVYKPKELYENLSIENWLLPLVYAKHIDLVVWVKPPWATQLPVSQQKFYVGQCSRSDTIRLTSKENYFLTDGLFRPTRELTDSALFTLQVEEILPPAWEELDTSYKPAEESRQGLETQPKMSETLGDKPYVLDIDLDFFSTANPFRNMLGDKEEKAIARLYSYTLPPELTDENLKEFSYSREDQLDQLEDIFTSLEEERLKLVSSKSVETSKLPPSLVELIRGVVDKGFDKERLPDLELICGSVLRSNVETARFKPPVSAISVSKPSNSEQQDISGLEHKPTQPNMKQRETWPDHSSSRTQNTGCGNSWSSSDGLTFLQLHDFGCTLDDTDLPHHLSSQHQVNALMAEVKVMLEGLPKPALVTIARSSDDGYCPSVEVDQYERDVLKLLQEVYGKLHITKHYDT